MISKKDFRKISDYLWEIPKDFRKDMRVPARIYLSEKMLEEAFRDRSIKQLINFTWNSKICFSYARYARRLFFTDWRSGSNRY